MQDLVLEAAIDNIENAKKAVENGANRLEVCYEVDSTDGMTPPKELLEGCLALNVKCFSMIRVNDSRDFTATAEEFNKMKEQILEYKKLANGFVLGLLKEDKTLDIERTKELVEFANPLPVTFHKAFDRVLDLEKAAKDLLKTGVKRVLTSGLKPTVLEGIDNIRKMQTIFNGNITIVCGGGVNYTNLAKVQSLLPFYAEYHGKKIVNTDK